MVFFILKRLKKLLKYCTRAITPLQKFKQFFFFFSLLLNCFYIVRYVMTHKASESNKTYMKHKIGIGIYRHEMALGLEFDKTNKKKIGVALFIV